MAIVTRTGELQLVFKVTDPLVFRGQERCEARGLESSISSRGWAGAVSDNANCGDGGKSDQGTEGVQLAVEGLSGAIDCCRRGSKQGWLRTEAVPLLS